MAAVTSIQPKIPPSKSLVPLAAPVKKLSCCQKICLFVKRIFLAFFSLFRSKPNKVITLTAQEKLCLASFNKYTTIPKYHPRVHRAFPIAKKQDLEEIIIPAAPPNVTIPLQETRQHLLDFSQDLGTIVTDIHYDKHFDALLQGIQAKAPDYVKIIKDQALLLVPVFGVGSQILECLNDHKTTKPLMATLQKPLLWLLKNQNQKGMEQGVLKQLQSHNASLPQRQTWNDYITPLFGWLFAFQKNPTGSHAAFALIFEDPKYDENAARMAKAAIFAFLLEAKIDESIIKLQNIVRNKLPDIIKKMMQANGNKLASILANRVIDLLEKVSFPETLDKITTLFNSQVLSYIAAEEVTPSILEKAKKVIANPSSVPPAVAAELAPVTDDLKKHGEQFCKQKIFLTEFSQHPSCHRRVKQLISGSKHQTIDISQFRQNLRKSYYPDLANLIISLVLPSEKVEMPNGQIKEIDGITSIWDQLIIPDEFKELIRSMTEMAQEFFRPEVMQGIAGLQAPIVKAIESYVISETQERLKPFLTNCLQKQIETLALPEQLNELAAYSILPAIIEVLLSNFSRHIIFTQADKFAPLFYSLLDKTKNKEAFLKHIKDRLIAQIPAQFISFSMKDAKITPQIIDGVISPLIVKIFHFFLHASVKMANFDGSKATAVLQAFFEVEDNTLDPKTHDLYGTVFDTLTFKLGKFGSMTAKFSSLDLIKKVITSTIIPALDIARKSHEGFVVVATDAIRRNYLSKPALEKLLLGPVNPPVPPAMTNAKLKENLSHISNLSHDLIMRASEQGGRLAKFTVKTFLGGNPASLNKLITDVYQKCFGDPLLNFNLLFQIQDTLSIALTSAAEDLREHSAIKPRKVSRQY